MENAKVQGFPTPEWSIQATGQQLIERFAGQFEFSGEGWYITSDQAILAYEASPSRRRDNNPLAALMAALGVNLPDGSDKDPIEERYVCYMWPTDPRQRVFDLLRLGDQTPVAVPEVMSQEWPKITDLAGEIQAWANGAIAEQAAARSATPVEIKALQSSCPDELVKGQVRTNKDGTAAYNFGTYVIHLLPKQVYDSLEESTKSVPYARFFETQQGGVAVSLQPPNG